MKKKQYKVVKKRPAFLRFLGKLLRTFTKKPQLINLNRQDFAPRAIYIMNHCGANGPMKFEMYFPVKCTPMGTHEMCGTYRERWNYLYHVFYQQKLHWGKFKSFCLATLFAIISKYIYKSTGLIATYTDGNIVSSFRNAFAVLDEDMSLVIFPENSENGYLDKPERFHKGFVHLAKLYHKRTGIDLPVYNVCYSKSQKKFVVGQPNYVNQLLQQGNTEDEVAQIFLENHHRLFDTYVSQPQAIMDALQEQN